MVIDLADGVHRTEMGKSRMSFRKPKRRFSELCNRVYEVGSLEDLTPELLLDFVQEHHTEQAPRLDELDDYYEGNNPTIYSRENREAHLSDIRLAHAYARYVSSFIQGYLVGNPIKVKHPDKLVNEKIDELNKMFKADRLNAEITLDLSIYGRAYELVYRSREDKDRVVRLDPIFTFVIYDDTVEKRPIAGIRYRVNRKKLYEVEVYTSNEILYYIQDDDQLIESKPKQSHYFADVPITEYSNNRFRLGDFEPVLDLIDAYDAAESDMSNYMTDINNAMLVILGNVDIDITRAKKMKEANTLLLIPSTDIEGHSLGNADAKYIYKQYDVNGVEAYKKRLQNDIHRFTNTPDMTDEKFSGQSSGESMKYKLFGLDQVRSDKETKMTDGLIRRYQLLFALKNTAQELVGIDANDLEFIFTPNIPRAFYEELKAFIEAGGQLSQETLLNITALVEDSQEEMEKIQEERESKLKMIDPNMVLRGDPYANIRGEES